MSKIKIGVSSCLLGNQVRFDGGHKKNKILLNEFADFLEFKPFCPELAIGMTIPRKPIRLIQKENIIDVVDPTTNKSYLKDLQEHANSIKTSDLDGFVFKKDSPSCGAFRVKTYHENGHKLHADGVGGFAKEFIKNNPNIPIEEEGRLTNQTLKDNFIQRVFLYHEIKKAETIKDLIEFHSNNKFLFYSYNQELSRSLGRLIGSYKKRLNFDNLKEEYILLMMKGTEKAARKSNHVNALIHIYGFLKKKLTPEERNDVLKLIDDYKNNKTTLVAPMSVITFLSKNKSVDYINKQTYIS